MLSMLNRGISCLRNEVQAHGFSWEKEILLNIYKLTQEEINEIHYTCKTDLPAKYNRLDGCDVSIKTTKQPNTVCMANCLSVFDSVSSGVPLHLIVIHYAQREAIKVVTEITKVDLTNSRNVLFGSLSREQIVELDSMVKSVPQKRKPTPVEHERMYTLRNALQEISGEIQLNIKCNSTQSRLQCSFNQFQRFVEKNPDRVLAKSNTHEFCGGCISPEIVSKRRVFKPKPMTILPYLEPS